MAPTLPVLKPIKSFVSIPGSGYDVKSSPICVHLGVKNDLLTDGYDPLIQGYVYQTQITVSGPSQAAAPESRPCTSSHPSQLNTGKRKTSSFIEKSPPKKAAKSDSDSKPSILRDEPSKQVLDDNKPLTKNIQIEKTENKDVTKNEHQPSTSANQAAETIDEKAAEAKRFAKLKNLLDERTMLRKINKELKSKLKEYQELMQSKDKLEEHLKMLEAEESE